MLYGFASGRSVNTTGIFPSPSASRSTSFSISNFSIVLSAPSSVCSWYASRINPLIVVKRPSFSISFWRSAAFEARSAASWLVYEECTFIVATEFSC